MIFACCWLLPSSQLRVVTNIPINSVVVQQCGVSRQMCDTQVRTELAGEPRKFWLSLGKEDFCSAIRIFKINCTAVTRKGYFLRLPSQEEKIL